MFVTGQSREEGSNGADLQPGSNSGEWEVKDVEGRCEGHENGSGSGIPQANGEELDSRRLWGLLLPSWSN